MSTTPMIGPDGSAALVPAEQVSNVLKAGGKIGVHMQAPTGEHAIVPMESAHVALQNGATAVDPGALAAMSVPKPAPPAEMKPYSDMNPSETYQNPNAGHFGFPLNDEQSRAAAMDTNIPLGAAKGAASTANNAGRAGQFLINKATGSNIGVFPKNPELLKPADNEKLGYGAEQMGEFLAPGALASKLGKAVSVAEDAPLLMRSLSALAKGGIEAGSAGGVEALHGGNAGDIAKTAGLAGGITTAGEMLPFAANAIKSHAEDLYAKALSPTKQTTKFLTQNKVVPGLLQRGEYGSLKGLSNKAEDATADIGDQMNTLMSARGSQTMSTKPILDSLEKAKQSYIVNGVPLNPDAIKPIEDLQSRISDMGNSSQTLGPGNQVSFNSLRNAKQILDNPVAAKGGYAGVSVGDKYVLSAQKTAANSIRAELAKADPDMAKLNAEYSFWSNVGDVVDSTILRRTGQQGGLLGNGTAEVLGAAAKGGTGAAIASGANLARKGATSGLARTFRSVQWSKLGNALANKDIPGMTKIAARLAAATSTQSLSSPQQ